MIKEFRGEYRWLSNFWPCAVVLDNVSYKSVENAYQAAKCENKADQEQFENCTAGQAKRLGRKVVMRGDWERVKVGIMVRLLEEKFGQEPLRSQLVETEDALIEEGNTWGDTFWGVCDGEGENYLGKLIMEIRTELISLCN